MKDYEKFLLTCINNRNVLEYSEKEMSSYLDGVSEKDYVDFERGKYLMSKNNLMKIVRILAIKASEIFSLKDYIDTEGLSDEDVADLTIVVSKIVGEENA